MLFEILIVAISCWAFFSFKGNDQVVVDTTTHTLSISFSKESWAFAAKLGDAEFRIFLADWFRSIGGPQDGYETNKFQAGYLRKYYPEYTGAITGDGPIALHKLGTLFELLWHVHDQFRHDFQDRLAHGGLDDPSWFSYPSVEEWANYEGQDYGWSNAGYTDWENSIQFEPLD